MLSIVPITLLIAASAVPPYLITTIRVSSKFGALRERFHIRRIWLQILKMLKEEKNAVREFLRYDIRYMFLLQYCLSHVTRKECGVYSCAAESVIYGRTSEGRSLKESDKA